MQQPTHGPNVGRTKQHKRTNEFDRQRCKYSKLVVWLKLAKYPVEWLRRRMRRDWNGFGVYLLTGSVQHSFSQPRKDHPKEAGRSGSATEHKNQRQKQNCLFSSLNRFGTACQS